MVEDCDYVFVVRKGAEDGQRSQSSTCLLRPRVAEVIACVGSPRLKSQVRAEMQDRNAENLPRGYKASRTISEYSCMRIEICGPSILNLAGEINSLA
jgi:hypothetical protein